MHLDPGSSDAIIVASTIELGHNLGLRIVAEGVEDGDTLQWLSALGCDVAQGYHISRPVAPETLIEVARSRDPSSAGLDASNSEDNVAHLRLVGRA